MPGKDKTTKAGKGKKGLEKEWAAALASADSGERVVTTACQKDELKKKKKESGKAASSSKGE